MKTQQHKILLFSSFILVLLLVINLVKADFTCFGFPSSSPYACNGNGQCVDLDKCDCNANYFGETCLPNNLYLFTYAGGNGEFVNPQRLVIDSTGDVIVADTGDHSLKKINGNTREVTRVIGTGVAGFSGDNGIANKAQLNSPYGVTIFNSEIYVADSKNNRIRKINSNGIISTVVGNGAASFTGDNGNATDCTLNNPLDIAFTSNGDMYIADLNNYRIRKVSGGIITTVVGNGQSGSSGDNGPATSASISSVAAIRVLDGGIIFILDGNKIRKVSGGIITTIAGTGIGPYNGDNILAVNANLNRPTDLLWIPTNEFMFSDTDNYRIRMILRNGTIITVGGNGVSGFSGDYEVATSGMVASPGCIIGTGTGMLITDAVNKRIRKTGKVKLTVPVCFGIPATSSNVCNGKGLCYADDKCQCSSTLTNISGASCNITSNITPVVSTTTHAALPSLVLIFLVFFSSFLLQ